MIERLSDITPRGKTLALVVLIFAGFVAGWLGYNLGHWMGAH